MINFPQQTRAARFLVIAGPSGAGKSTLIQRFLRNRPDVLRCLSVTTRPPRGQERDGVDYFFVTPEEFSRRIATDAFLEHATVFGRHSYGTPRSYVEENLRAGRSVIKDVDVQGARQIHATFPTALTIFVVPPDRAEIERRLRGRGTEDADSIARRLAEADIELAAWGEFDYLIINDDLDRAAADLEAILRAEQLLIP